MKYTFNDFGKKYDYNVTMCEIFYAIHTTDLRKQMLKNMKHNTLTKAFYLCIQISRLFFPGVS